MAEYASLFRPTPDSCPALASYQVQNDPPALVIQFDSGDRLIVFDQPHERSCWFMHFDSAQSPIPLPGKLIWSLNDLEPEDAGRIGFLGWPIIPLQNPNDQS
jgi:hypothetical protein